MKAISLAGARAAPLAAEAQQRPAAKPSRTVAFLCSDSCTTLPSIRFPSDEAFVRGLERAGYVLGRDIQVDSSAVGIGIEQLPERARRLAGRKVTLIVVMTTLAGLAVTFDPNLAELFDGASDYVARILNGAKPSELPIEEPRRKREGPRSHNPVVAAGAGGSGARVAA